jgi:hypothetical protein
MSTRCAARDVPWEITVRFASATAKAAEHVQQRSFRDEDVWVVRRAQALLEAGPGQTVPFVAARLGLAESTVYRAVEPGAKAA